MKRKIAIAVAVIMLSSLCLTMPVAGAVGTNVKYHTIQDVNSYIQTNGAKIGDSVTYGTMPSITAPYNPGTLTTGSLGSALNMLNQVRYIAGIDDDVTLKQDYVDKAQACALLNAANNVLDHFPKQPPGMDPALYDLGYDGAQNGNIAWGFSSLNYALIGGWMSDDDKYNISDVGHRRWVLNPRMAATGFGKVNSYTAMYAFDRGRVSSYKGVAWPAQSMPLDYFASKMPWSISMGATVNKATAKVTLKRASDGKVWSFSEKKADGFFNVNNQGYGAIGCIIFRPNSINYKSGDVFNVSITGAGTPVNYNVKFFKIGTNPASLIAPGKTTGTKAKAGKKRMIVSWKKDISATGYQLLYATNKGFTKGKKTINITKNATDKKTIKKLKKGKTYYVKVCAYKTVNGVKLYGAYSSEAKCKIK